MKFKYLIPCVLAAALTACNNSDDAKWEYKIIKLSENDGKTLQEVAYNTASRAYGSYGSELDARMPIPFSDPTAQLNKAGEEGWELVNVYTTTETVFPNFGNADYHTGIKDNVRTQTVNFVFKRRATKDGKENQEAKKSDNSQNSQSVEETTEVLTVDPNFQDTASVN